MLKSKRFGPALISIAMAGAIAGCGTAKTNPSPSGSGSSQAGGGATTSGAGGTTGGGASAQSSGMPTGPAARSNASPCALLTAADAQNVLKAPVSAQPSVTPPGCTYSTGGPRLVDIAQLRIVELRDANRAKFDAAKAATTGASDLSGVGDAAISFASGTNVLVLKGSTIFQLIVVQPHGSADLVPVAKKIAAAL